MLLEKTLQLRSLESNVSQRRTAIFTEEFGEGEVLCHTIVSEIIF